MISFLLSNAAYLKYFLPVVKVLNARNEKSCFYLVSSVKYSSPHLHLKHINALSDEFKFEIKNAAKLDKMTGTLLSIEGLNECVSGSDLKKISLTALTDFTNLYDSYIDRVDNVIFPSKFFAEHYKKLSRKNRYFGSPKYDINFNADDITSKYNIKSSKNVLILFPRSRDLGVFNMTELYRRFHNMGYSVIVKTRGKDPVAKSLRGDQYYEDLTWFPHTTMELMEICDLVVNFDSTAIKECVMMDAPVLNFHVKPFKKPMDFLYNYKYCRNLDAPFTMKGIEDTVVYLTTTDFTDEFKLARKNHLFEKGNVSEKIVDFIMGQK